MLKVGEPAPDFTLEDDEGGSVTLASLRAEGPFVLYFYPADFTPVCTRQACMFRDMHPELVSAGVRVFGVSPQDAETHGRFREAHQLPFPLLVDHDLRVAEAFGALLPMGLGIRRASFLVDTDGRIADAVGADLRVGRHEAFARRVIERVRAGR